MDGNANYELFSEPDALDALLSQDINESSDTKENRNEFINATHKSTSSVESYSLCLNAENSSKKQTDLSRDQIKTEIHPFYYTGPYITPIKQKRTKNYHCRLDGCRRSFLLETSYKTHLLLHEKTQSKCQYCNKVVSNKNALLVHEAKHYGKDGKLKSFKCYLPGCDKVFVTVALLNQHESLHVQSDRHTCEICCKQFTSRYGYLAHMSAVHVDTKNHSCIECRKCFKSLNELNVHIKLHSNEKTHICKVCGNEFFRRSNLLRHELIHRSKNFFCNVCFASFHYSRSLTWHMLKHHPIARVKELESVTQTKKCSRRKKVSAIEAGKLLFLNKKK